MAMAKDTILLIDGHAVAFRMFYALPLEAFTTREGEPTNATYGFTRLLMDYILAEDPPDYIAVSFDVGRTFRDDIFPEYKGTREKAPEELHIQVRRIREMVQAFNIPILEQDGYEADDVLGTVACQAAEHGTLARILTGDRDLLQLVTADIHVLYTGRRETEEFDPSVVEARMGIRPDQIVDYKALVGDSSDNIPGVRGVGDKTAVKLLNQYDTLEAIYDHLDEIQSTRFRNALEAGRDDAFLSRRLARIITDVPIRLDLEACRTHDFDRQRVAELMTRLQFQSLGERFRDGVPTPGQQLSFFDKPSTSAPSVAAAPTVTQAHIVTTSEALAALSERLRAADAIAFDTETTGTDEITADLVGIALSPAAGEGYYIPVGHSLPEDRERQLPLNEVLAALQPAFSDPAIPKVGHNAKYDLTMLRRYGLDVTPIGFDTMIAAWLLEPASRGLGLKNQAWVRLGVEMTEIVDLIGRGRGQITMAQVPVAQAAPYAAADVDMPLRLRDKQAPELHEKRLWRLFTDVEMPLIPVLSDMERAGVAVDVAALREMSAELAEQLAAVEQSIFELAGQEFNVNSTQQLSQVLFEDLELPTEGLRRTKTGHYSTAAGVLESLIGAHEIVDLVLQHRELAKLKSTYVDSLPEMVNPATGRIHTSFNQVGAITGRLASNNPNLQNIPIRTELGREVRRAFVARPGWLFLAVDYSQVELRVLAHISRDPGLLQAFRRGEDIHAATAAAIYSIRLDEVTPNQRRFAKSVNFGLLYGMSAFRLARESDLTLGEAERFQQAYFDSFPNVRGYLERTIRQAREQGWVETVLGRRRYFPVLQSAAGSRTSALAQQRAEREAVNFPIQGSAADIIKIAMINLHRALLEDGFESQMLLQVHDELVLEVPEDEVEPVTALVVDLMENAYELRAPLTVDTKVGSNWLDMS
jgi:DNA polymerase-1